MKSLLGLLMMLIAFGSVACFVFWAGWECHKMHVKQQKIRSELNPEGH